MEAPGVRVHPERPLHAPDLVAVQDHELEREFLAHLLLPLHLERRRADDQDPSDAALPDQFLDDQARLDRLAESDVVGEEEVDPRHGERLEHGKELVILNLNGRKVWREQRRLSVRHGVPIHRIDPLRRPA